MKAFDSPGFAVVETNHINSIRTGEIKAQYPCIKPDWIENGMLLRVDDVAKIVKRASDPKQYCHLHASEERIYNSMFGRNSWRLNCQKEIPKMLKLSEGDIFETDAVLFDNFADEAEARDDAVYGIPDATGYIQLVPANHANILTDYSTVLKIVEWIHLPNESPGIKFVVLVSDPKIFLMRGRLIFTFNFLDDDNGMNLAEDIDGVVDNDNYTITLNVPNGTDVTVLVPAFTVSSESTVYLGSDEVVSGVTDIDFTEPVELTVVSENGLTNTYTVTVIVDEP